MASRHAHRARSHSGRRDQHCNKPPTVSHQFSGENGRPAEGATVMRAAHPKRPEDQPEVERDHQKGVVASGGDEQDHECAVAGAEAAQK